MYDPDSPRSDAHGFRADVAEALRALDMPCVRYPGGNFVSNYDWRDGVGPPDQRPSRPDFAWKSIEPNTFGVDEFVRWCREIGTEPMMAVNLGTLGPREAADLVEYCNLEGGTHWSDARRANGAPDPHAVGLWCLGNEMDGPWQAGHCPAPEYARKARQAARLMRGIDPSVELVLCGSSGRGMATYLEWDRTVLEHCWDEVEYISAHRYSGNREDDTPWFLAEGVEIDRILDDYAGLLAYVRGVKKSDKRVHVAFDEWNVWYKNHETEGGWTVGPSLLEEVYNLEDALVCAQYLNSFLRHADVVRIACLAQIVNVIAPVLTRPDGLLVQSIYHPLRMFSRHAKGVSLPPRQGRLPGARRRRASAGAYEAGIPGRGPGPGRLGQPRRGDRRGQSLPGEPENLAGSGGGGLLRRAQGRDGRRGGGPQRGRPEGSQLLGKAGRGRSRQGKRRPGRRREAAGESPGPRTHSGPGAAGAQARKRQEHPMNKPQVILDDKGQPAFVVIPWRDYERLASGEEYYDRAIADNGESFPIEVVDQLLAGKNPISVYRNHRGMTQRALAAAAGINAVYLSQIETGKRTGSARTLAALAKALRVTVDDLL